MGTTTYTQTHKQSWRHEEREKSPSQAAIDEKKNIKSSHWPRHCRHQDTRRKHHCHVHSNNLERADFDFGWISVDPTMTPSSQMDATNTRLMPDRAKRETRQSKRHDDWRWHTHTTICDDCFDNTQRRHRFRQDEITTPTDTYNIPVNLFLFRFVFR